TQDRKGSGSMEDRAMQIQDRQESFPDEEQGHGRPRAGRGVLPMEDTATADPGQMG
ncbi:hypothetical protein P7K49_007470, partial [Saguinus oedipus]